MASLPLTALLLLTQPANGGGLARAPVAPLPSLSLPVTAAASAAALPLPPLAPASPDLSLARPALTGTASALPAPQLPASAIAGLSAPAGDGVPITPVADYLDAISAVKRALARHGDFASLAADPETADWFNTPSWRRMMEAGRMALQGGALSLSMNPELRHENAAPPLRDPFLPWASYPNADGAHHYRVRMSGTRLVEDDGSRVEGNGIIVIDLNGDIYINTDPSREFKHSSFNSGSDVLFAGEVAVRDGRIVGLSAWSGHYRPPEVFILQALSHLASRGVDINTIGVVPAEVEHGIQTAFPLPNDRSRDLLPFGYDQ